MTHLRTITIEELVRRNYSAATRECYIRGIEDFALYFNCPPDKLGLEHIRHYQAHLFTDKKLSPNPDKPEPNRFKRCANLNCILSSGHTRKAGRSTDQLTVFRSHTITVSRTQKGNHSQGNRRGPDWKEHLRGGGTKTL